jgi:hypothetical protein
MEGLGEGGGKKGKTGKKSWVNAIGAGNYRNSDSFPWSREIQNDGNREL